MRYFILESSDHIVDYNVIHECAVDSRAEAVKAFRILYGSQPEFILVEQVACSEPAGSCDEANNASRDDSLLSTIEQLDDLHRL